MKSYIDYFEPGGNVRYITRYITQKPEGKEEIPNTTYTSYLTWLASKWKEKNATKKVNAQVAQNTSSVPSNTGSKYVVDLYHDTPYSTDTVRVGNRVIIVNNRPQS